MTIEPTTVLLGGMRVHVSPGARNDVIVLQSCDCQGKCRDGLNACPKRVMICGVGSQRPAPRPKATLLDAATGEDIRYQADHPEPAPQRRMFDTAEIEGEQ